LDNFTKEELKDFIIGTFVVIAAVIVAIIYRWQNKVWENAQDSDYPVYATFNRTDGLEVGSKVRMAGIDIGYVDDSVLDDNFRATLTLMIKAGIEIPDDSSASIVSSGVMGNKYIEIEAGGSEDFIAEGEEFEYTQDAMVLEELVDRIIAMGKANRQAQKAGNKCPDAVIKSEITAQETEEN